MSRPMTNASQPQLRGVCIYAADWLTVKLGPSSNCHGFETFPKEFPVFFGKLLPRDTNFFKLFNQHADHIVEAAHAFSKLVANYGDLTSAREIPP